MRYRNNAIENLVQERDQGKGLIHQKEKENIIDDHLQIDQMVQKVQIEMK